MLVLGSRRTSLHCGSLGSKKENSKGRDIERKRGTLVCVNSHSLWRRGSFAGRFLPMNLKEAAAQTYIYFLQLTVQLIYSND